MLKVIILVFVTSKVAWVLAVKIDVTSVTTKYMEDNNFYVLRRILHNNQSTTIFCGGYRNLSMVHVDTLFIMLKIGHPKVREWSSWPSRTQKMKRTHRPVSLALCRHPPPAPVGVPRRCLAPSCATEACQLRRITGCRRRSSHRSGVLWMSSQALNQRLYHTAIRNDRPKDAERHCNL